MITNTWRALPKDLQDFKRAVDEFFFQGQLLSEEDFEVFCRNTLWSLWCDSKDLGNAVVR